MDITADLRWPAAALELSPCPGLVLLMLMLLICDIRRRCRDRDVSVLDNFDIDVYHFHNIQ